MASVTFNIQINSGTQTDLPNGRTLSAYIYPNGSFPTGAYVTNATLYVSNFRCYTGSNARLQLGPYGTTSSFSKNESEHSETVSVSLSNSIVGVTGENITLTVLSGNNGNALNFRSNCFMTLTVDYAISAAAFDPSTATLTTTSVEAGEQIGISISNANLSDVSHKLAWSCGTYNDTYSIDKGVGSSTFTIPIDWLNAITRSESGIGYIKISTIANGTTVGSNTYSFTIKVPSSIVPTFESFVAERVDNSVPLDWGIYVQNKSGVKLIVNGAAGSYGSSISNYVYSGGFSSTTTSNTQTVNTIYESGTIKYTVKIVDSRGRSVSASVQINVEPYATPSFLSASAFRCGSDGIASEDGTNICGTAGYQVSSCGGKNTYSCSIYYGLAGYNEWSTGKENAEAGSSYVFGNNTISTENNYQTRFVISDTFTTVERIVDVSTTGYTLFLQRGGNAIGVGMECSTGAINVMEINPDWDIKRGNVKLFEYLQGQASPQINIIYSSSEPAVVEGAIWLKPV